MNKRYLFLFSFLIILLFQIPFVKKNVIIVFNAFKETALNIKNKISNEIEAISIKKEELNSLKKENEELKFKLNKLESYFYECKDLKAFKRMDKDNLIFVKAVSYVKIPDFTSVYVTFDSNFTHPMGLVYNNLAAGVLVKKVGNYGLAYLNSNPKTSYTVFIGQNEIPGIFYGKENVIKYIPKFKQINVGDLVITSGLDGIFYKGALVGKVTRIEQKKLYQEAKVKLFYDKLNPTYFYAVKGVDTNVSKQIINPQK